MFTLRSLILLAITLPAFTQSKDARLILQRALEVTGMSANQDRVLHWQDQQSAEQNYQSAPPFLTFFWTHESWLANAIERIMMDTTKMRRFGEQSRIRAVQLFNEETIVTHALSELGLVPHSG